MSVEAKTNGAFVAEDIMIKLKQIDEQRESAIDIAQQGAQLAVNMLKTAATADLYGSETRERRGDISALHTVLPDLIEARRRIYSRRSWGTAEYIGPIKKPQDSTLEYFAGGLLLAAQAWEHTILGQVDGIDFRVDPDVTREEAAEAYYAGHEFARG